MIKLPEKKGARLFSGDESSFLVSKGLNRSNLSKWDNEIKESGKSMIEKVKEKKNWFHSPAVQRFLGGGLIERFGIQAIGNMQMTILAGHKERSDTKLVGKVRKARRSLLTVDEYYMILSLAKTFVRREGSFIEIGTFQGCSARLICEVKGDKKFYVCDTYEGLPAGHKKDRAIHKVSQYACSLESVSRYLEGFPNVEFVKGFFPTSAEGVIPEDEKFAFAHIDVDLYEGTLEGIRYLYPKMIPGGIIISHDYSVLSGVNDAVNELAEELPGAILLELPTTQAMIIKSAAS